MKNFMKMVIASVSMFAMVGVANASIDVAGYTMGKKFDRNGEVIYSVSNNVGIDAPVKKSADAIEKKYFDRVYIDSEHVIPKVISANGQQGTLQSCEKAMVDLRSHLMKKYSFMKFGETRKNIDAYTALLTQAKPVVDNVQYRVNVACINEPDSDRAPYSIYYEVSVIR